MAVAAELSDVGYVRPLMEWKAFKKRFCTLQAELDAPGNTDHAAGRRRTAADSLARMTSAVGTPRTLSHLPVAPVAINYSSAIASKACAIAASGAMLPRLVQLLTDSRSDVQVAAAIAVHNVAAACTDSQRAVAAVDGIIPQLVGQLAKLTNISYGRTHGKVACQALWTLGELAKNNVDNQRAIVAVEGALELAVRLVRTEIHCILCGSLYLLGHLAHGNADNQRAIVTLQPGVLDRLVALLTCSGDSVRDSSTIRRYAAWVLGRLGSGIHDNQCAIMARSGLLQGLVSQLRGKDTQSAVAAWTLGYLAEHNTDNQRRIASTAGVIQLLVKIVNRDCFEDARAAARTLGWLAEDNSDNQSKIGCVSGVLPGLERLLRSKEKPSVASAAWTLGHLAKGHVDNQRAIGEADGMVACLVKLLGNVDNQTRLASSRTLAHLAKVNHDTVVAVDAAVPSLVRLLRDDVCGAQLDAARALGELASHNGSTQRAIAAESGAISSMLAMLADKRANFRLAGAQALGNLANDNMGNQCAIAAVEGAVPTLVSLLHDDSSEIRCSSAGTIAALVAKNTEVQRSVSSIEGVLTRLVEMLQDTSCHVRRNAAFALATLARNNRDNQRNIVSETGPLDQLAELLLAGDAGVRRYAALLLRLLATDNEETRRAVVQVRGLADILVGLLDDESAAVQCNASWTLSTLADDTKGNSHAISVVEQAMHEFMESFNMDGSRASGACDRSSTSNDRGVTAGASRAALLAVVGFLGDSSVYVRRHAVKAMSILVEACHINESSTAVAVGAVEKCVALLGDPDTDTRCEAAVVLRQLAMHSVATRRVIHGADGALDRLAELLRDGDADVRSNAALALAAIRPRYLKRIPRVPGAAGPGATRGMPDGIQGTPMPSAASMSVHFMKEIGAWAPYAQDRSNPLFETVRDEIERLRVMMHGAASSRCSDETGTVDPEPIPLVPTEVGLAVAVAELQAKFVSPAPSTQRCTSNNTTRETVARSEMLMPRVPPEARSTAVNSLLVATLGDRPVAQRRLRVANEATNAKRSRLDNSPGTVVD